MNRIDEIRKRMEKATDGPWKTYMPYPNDPDEQDNVTVIDRHNNTISYGGDFAIDDMPLIAHARADIPYLLSEIERLRVVIEGTIKSYDEEITDTTARRYWYHKMKAAIAALKETRNEQDR